MSPPYVALLTFKNDECTFDARPYGLCAKTLPFPIFSCDFSFQNLCMKML
jgi:hypothetical protein